MSANFEVKLTDVLSVNEFEDLFQRAYCIFVASGLTLTSLLMFRNTGKSFSFKGIEEVTNSPENKEKGQTQWAFQRSAYNKWRATAVPQGLHLATPKDVSHN